MDGSLWQWLSRGLGVQACGAAAGGSGGSAYGRCLLSQHEGFVVCRSIDADSGVVDDGDSDAGSGLQCSQLFKFFQLFERRWWQSGQSQQEFAAITVQADVQEEWRGLAFAKVVVGCGIPGEGDLGPAEVHSVSECVGDEFDAGRVAQDGG